jgi:DNA-directed RNA polymerase specialized sigma24 family protein
MRTKKSARGTSSTRATRVFSRMATTTLATTESATADLEARARELHERGDYKQSARAAIELYRGRIYDHLHRALGPSRAPDAYGTYCEKVVRGFPRFRWNPATPTLATEAGRPPRHTSVLLGWLTKVARRVAIDVLRKQGPEEPLSALDSRDPILAQPGRTMESNVDAARRLKNALDELSVADQEFLELASRKDLTELVKIYLPEEPIDTGSKNRIAQRLSRARERLMRKLERGRQ